MKEKTKTYIKNLTIISPNNESSTFRLLNKFPSIFNYPFPITNENAPKQYAVTIFFGNLEIAEYQQKDKQIIDRERHLDEITGEKFFCFDRGGGGAVGVIDEPIDKSVKN